MDSTNSQSESLMPAEKSPRELLPLLADTIIGVSHELNNCIGIVLGNVQLLRLKHDHTEFEENYNRIEKSLFHGASLIRQVQKFAEKSGKAPATSLEMSKLVSKAVETDESDWKTLASEKNLTLLTDLPECKLFVKADGRDLITAISQLLKNAVEHAPPDSEITIILRIEGTRCKVIVTDSGQGIPAAFRHRIYEPVYSS
ncbi:MAG: HAMP domain-containing histidine kinase, partial [candidate division Zixibacteria bacterium]|nr:HAMP domain-containing histidine kinase [candidate division Zixibacteria bacterium]